MVLQMIPCMIMTCNHKFVILSFPMKIGETPLYLASRGGHVEIVKLLIQRKADVNICNQVYLRIVLDSSNLLSALQNGCSPVCAASEKGHTEVVDLLVSAGADIHWDIIPVSTLLCMINNTYWYHETSNTLLRPGILPI